MIDKKLIEEHRRFPRSTIKLRKIRDAGLEEIDKYRDKRYLIIHSATIHFFEDCMLVQGDYEAGYLILKENERNRKTFTVYSKDYGQTWHEYKDQFEPKDGKHKAVKYEPHDTSFPTSNW